MIICQRECDNASVYVYISFEINYSDFEKKKTSTNVLTPAPGSEAIQFIEYTQHNSGAELERSSLIGRVSLSKYYSLRS